MSKTTEAAEVLPKLLEIVSSDIAKSTHYLKQAVAVAIVAEDKHMATKLAQLYVELEDLSKVLERVVTPVENGE